jgi:hypothetical protein
MGSGNMVLVGRREGGGSIITVLLHKVLVYVTVITPTFLPH